MQTERRLTKKHLDGEKFMKYQAELNYWQSRYIAENNNFENAWYRQLMMAMLSITNESIMDNKIILDFGCGPRGSLAWATTAKLRIGADVLIPTYLKNFGQTMIKHNMLYLTSTEEHIPVPADTIDILFTINSLDHTDNLNTMCSELLRILKPGGIFVGSFNLNEPISICEPQTLNENILENNLFKFLNTKNIKVAYKGKSQTYENFFLNKLIPANDLTTPCILWYLGNKK